MKFKQLGKRLIASIIFLLIQQLTVYGTTIPPSLIPLPQTVTWANQNIPLSNYKWIQIKNKSLIAEAKRLKEILALNGKVLKIKQGSVKADEAVIELKLSTVIAPQLMEEAYSINVNRKGIELIANTEHGIFNGIQTLRQLITRHMEIAGCVITDYPAYQWRGYMLDVARNYETMGFIKEQIDVMSRYKLNTFHIHLTDNPAWRLQIKKYPQLTAGEYMVRDKGKYYTVEELKELISYCKDRHITLIPEIDVPGHSESFKRAMGTDMQSAAGLEYVKNILLEVCRTYNVPYIHIGADEVKIHNQQFLPEITKLIQQQNKQVIGWNPGGKYDETVIQQLWREEAGKLEGLEGSPIKYLDSRHLYLNHMDPENSVVNIFTRQIGSKLKGTSTLLGGELCIWTDRLLTSEETMPVLNPLYPGMLAFSERIWRGGGYPGVVSHIGSDTSLRANEFKAFEDRLIDHKKNYFKQLAFPYVKQSHIQWKLFGPFNNDGKLSATFWPEQRNVSLKDSSISVRATGATIFLRHFFAPGISSWLTNPKENTTWYAYTSFYSNSDTTLSVWLGTKDISRTHTDETPPPGGWDYLKSAFYLNGKEIPPPVWARAGKDGGWEVPFIDEGYTYRSPTTVQVKKGWNEVVVKLPVGTFKSKSWDHPVKWMFTFVPVHKDGINWVADDLQFSIDNK